MENASDALKIAFALIVFTTAIATLFILTTNTRSTADTIFEYIDDTNYYDPIKSKDADRPVGVSEIVGTLYRYYKESICVTIVFRNGERYVFDRGNENYHYTQLDGTAIQLNNAKNIELNIDHFVSDVLYNPDHINSRFVEKFVEIPRSGIYAYDENSNSEFTLKAGSRKVYITYEEQP